MKVIYVVTTGGTIEKAYSEPTGEVANLGTKIDCYLRLLRLPGTEIRVVPLVNKDSLEMTDSNRRLVLGAVAGLLPEDAPIVVTHGTDTMVETGRFLDSVTTELRVPIILTGGWFHWDLTEATRCKTSPRVCLPLVRSVRESTW